jgi:hypothetical protein
MRKAKKSVAATTTIDQVRTLESHLIGFAPFWLPVQTHPGYGTSSIQSTQQPAMLFLKVVPRVLECGQPQRLDAR